MQIFYISERKKNSSLSGKNKRFSGGRCDPCGGRRLNEDVVALVALQEGDDGCGDAIRRKAVVELYALVWEIGLMKVGREVEEQSKI